MTMNPEDIQDRRSVVWMGKIPLGEEDKYRYPTEFDLEMMLYETEVLTEEEYDAMTEEELEEFYKEAKKIVKERLSNNL
tara:strand:- start:5318 stop:5554 length:237 start_codon:yes stop_codon:yes gene_type:complete